MNFPMSIEPQRSFKETKRSSKLLPRSLRARYSVGEGIQQDVIKAHVEVSKMVDELIMLGQKKRALEAKINILLNRPPETPLGKPEEVILQAFPSRLKNFRRWP